MNTVSLISGKIIATEEQKKIEAAELELIESRAKVAKLNEGKE